MRGSLARRLLACAFAAVLSVGLPASAAERVLRLSTTTSTENSGLLKHILPAFETRHKVRVQVIAVGTGKALKLAENGDVDVVLVHSRADEDRFMASGYGVNRREVMYNDFVLAGPASDPARVRGMRDATSAFRRIGESGARFISRGDESGTHRRELEFWQSSGARPRAPAYILAGAGMGQVLMMAGEMQAYTLADRATFSTYRTRSGLEVLVEGDPHMLNHYSVIAVNPERHRHVNYKDANKFVEWLTSADAAALIAGFRPGGIQLFHPAPQRVAGR